MRSAAISWRRLASDDLLPSDKQLEFTVAAQIASGVCNHLSALIPGTNNDRFLIAPYGMLWCLGAILGLDGLGILALLLEPAIGKCQFIVVHYGCATELAQALLQPTH